MRATEIVTPRLRLVAMTAEMLEADARNGAEFAALLGADVPGAWPPEHWEPHVFEFLKKQYAETPHAAAWNRYVVLRSASPVVIGNMNAFPKGGDEAEVGYSILPAWQRQGLATEGLRAFVSRLLVEQGMKRITAQTYPTLVASIRVLEKCEFRPDGAGEKTARCGIVLNARASRLKRAFRMREVRARRRRLWRG